MRYFAIVEQHRVVAMADEDALARVIADHLGQYKIGVFVQVQEVPQAEFDAYKRKAGTVRC